MAVPGVGNGPTRSARWLTRAAVYGGLFAAFTLVPLAARWSWLAEVTTHFRVQYAVILAALAATLALGRRWRASFVLALFAGGQAEVFAPALWAPRAPPPASKS